jgi:hypothetical protein
MEMRRSLTGAVLMAVAILGSSSVLFAQYGTGQAPNREPEAERTGPPPSRDLTGVWMRRTPPGVFGSGATFTREPPALTPWGEEKFKEAKDSNGGAYTLDETNDPVLTKCYPPGVPRVYFHPYPFEFVHTPKYTLMLFEYDHTVRRIYTDGRAHPSDPDPLWLGHSIGHWEGNTTFVVDTVGFNEKTWLDRLGHPHSDQLHVIERFRRVDWSHLELDITMEDPKALAKPWSTTLYYQMVPADWELGEISCSGDYLEFDSFEDPEKK